MTKHISLAAVLALSMGFAHAQSSGTPLATPTAVAPSELSALVIANHEATLSAQMAGKIKKVYFDIGQQFAAGAVLVEFDCAEAQTKLDALNAEYMGARETHLAKLKLQGLGAAGDLEVTLAAAAGERAKSLVRQQETQMAYCFINAPYDGKVARLKAKQAENVAPSQPVLEIVASAALKATLHVPTAIAARLRPGSKLFISFRETGRRYAASVSRMNSRVDGVSQSLELEATFVGNTTGLLPGMIGQAQFSDAAGKNK